MALLWFGAACHTPASDAAATMALTGATLIDPASGQVTPTGVVLVRDDRIVAVGDAATLRVPRGATRIALDGQWVIPGLLDVHTRLQPWGLDLSLAWGITTVRDLHAGVTEADQLLAHARTMASPRLISAVAMLDAVPVGVPGALAIHSPASIEAQLDTLVAHGARWVMVSQHVTPEVLDGVVAAARDRGLPVAAHLGLTDARTAVALGVASLEHLSGIPEAVGDSAELFAAHRAGALPGWTAFEEGWLGADTTALLAMARELARTGVTLVPTLGLHEIRARLDDPAITSRGDLALVPDSVRTTWGIAGLVSRAGWTAATFADFRAARRVQDAFVVTFVRAGGRVATGSGASAPLLVPGAGLHLELELLVAAGLTPMEALQAATLRGADLLRSDALGRLRPNALADLVVLGADPLRDIRNTRRIVRVMQGGRWVR